MPSNVVQSFATKTGKSVSEVEKLWDKAKKSAADQGRAEDYAYITGILKNMLGLGEKTERVTLKQFLESKKSFNELYEDAQVSGDFTAITPTNPKDVIDYTGKDIEEEDEELIDLPNFSTDK